MSFKSIAIVATIVAAGAVAVGQHAVRSVQAPASPAVGARGFAAVKMNSLQDAGISRIAELQDEYQDQVNALTRVSDADREELVNKVMVITNKYIRGLLDPQAQKSFDKHVLQTDTFKPKGGWIDVVQTPTMVKHILTASAEQDAAVRKALSQRINRINLTRSKLDKEHGTTRTDAWRAAWRQNWKAAYFQFDKDVRARMTKAQREEYEAHIANMVSELNAAMQAVR